MWQLNENFKHGEKKQELPLLCLPNGKSWCNGTNISPTLYYYLMLMAQQETAFSSLRTSQLWIRQCVTWDLASPIRMAPARPFSWIRSTMLPRNSWTRPVVAILISAFYWQGSCRANSAELSTSEVGLDSYKDYRFHFEYRASKNCSRSCKDVHNTMFDNCMVYCLSYRTPGPLCLKRSWLTHSCPQAKD